MINKILYDFEGFRVDTHQRCLWRDEDIVSLTPKAFETLLVLIRNNGNVVTKDAILDEVWKDTFVEEATLAQNISTLRKTLAKYDKDTEFITTIPRRGYRFVVDVTEINADEEVLVLEKHSVTHIVAEQEQIHDSVETAVAHQTVPQPSSFANKKLLIGLPLAIVTLLVIGVIAIPYFSRSNAFYDTKFEKFQVNNLLSSGNINSVMASPDGKYIATFERKATGDTISLKQVQDGNIIEVLPNSDLHIIGTTFSPKGDYIYYSAYNRNSTVTPKYGKLYKIPILGGASQEILNDIDSPVAISNDNQKIAFIRNNLDEKQSVLITADTDGSNEKKLAVRELVKGFSTVGLSFSPDDRFISSVISDQDDEKLPTKIVLVGSENGEVKPLTTQNWLWIGKTVWLKDGSGMAFVAYGAESPNLTDEIWFVSYPEGEAKVITNGIKGVNGVSLTNDSNSLIASKINRITSSYVAPFDDLENAVELDKTADEVSPLQLGTDWTNDEKIVFAKTQNGNADIWIMDSDGKNQKQLTSEKSAEYIPKVSADGKYVFFLSNRNGSNSIWRMTIEGKNAKEIVKGKSLFAPTLSPNNDAIYYSAKASDKQYNVLWKADFDGNNAKEVTSFRTYGGKISSDGKYVFCFYPDTTKDPNDIAQPIKLTVLSTKDFKVVKQFASLTTKNLPKVEWQQDSKSFLILKRQNGISKLLVQELENKEPKVLKEWNDESVYQIAISKDGKKLFFEKGKEVNSVIQLKDISD